MAYGAFQFYGVLARFKGSAAMKCGLYKGHDMMMIRMNTNKDDNSVLETHR